MDYCTFVSDTNFIIYMLIMAISLILIVLIASLIEIKYYHFYTELKQLNKTNRIKFYVLGIVATFFSMIWGNYLNPDSFHATGSEIFVSYPEIQPIYDTLIYSLVWPLWLAVGLMLEIFFIIAVIFIAFNNSICSGITYGTINIIPSGINIFDQFLMYVSTILLLNGPLIYLIGYFINSNRIRKRKNLQELI